MSPKDSSMRFFRAMLLSADIASMVNPSSRRLSTHPLYANFSNEAMDDLWVDCPIWKSIILLVVDSRTVHRQYLQGPNCPSATRLIG
ncbi:hypothetical protein GDO81_019214 [Engystomops pustulosus]|uniref:Uncharacterized protein n=1 Tax=Engystomops pustulosus TaxID=76066 RepID=A0AAV6YUV1_ENGPU|nr:hypothetical protein GDO81_019214 [Engystomops pustulosus]